MRAPRQPEVPVDAGAGRRDAYADYTRRFFQRWVSVYDRFAATIAPVYELAARSLEPARGRVILDVCTGTGAVAIRCAERGASVTGIDLTEAMLDRASRSVAGLPVRLQQCDARRLPFANRSFDASVISLGLHDMPRRARLETLAEMRRVTRTRLVVVDYDFSRTGWLAPLLVRMVGTFESAYFPRFAAEDTRCLLEEAGWSRHETLAPPWPWSWCFSIRVVELDDPPGAS